MDVPRFEVAGAAIRDRVYVVGGVTAVGPGPSAVVEAYDTIADRWSSVAPLPVPLRGVAAAAAGGVLYAVGGFGAGDDAVADVFAYDPAADTWTARAPLPAPRAGTAAVAFGGKLYVAAGRFGLNLAAFESYDPASDSWESLPPIPTPRSGIAAAVIGNRIYVFGGEGNPASPFGVFDEVESYDFAARSWRSELPMPTPRHGIGAAAAGGRIVVPGGAPVRGFGNTAISDAFVPDPPERRRAARH